MNKNAMKTEETLLAQEMFDYEKYEAPIIEVVEVRNEQNILGGSNPATAPDFGNGGKW